MLLKLRWPCVLLLMGTFHINSLNGQVITQVPCSTVPPLPYGPRYTSYQGEEWEFWVSSAYVGTGSDQGASGRFAFAPNPAYSETQNGYEVRWTNPGMQANCIRIAYQTPNGTVFDYRLEATAVFGYMTKYYVGDDNDGGCDYQLYPDPSQCPEDDDGGAGGDGAPDQPGGSSGSSNWCTDLKLEPGCYDVYVDDQYRETICC